MARTPPFSEGDLRAVVAQASCWSDALRLLGYVPKGSNYKTLRRYIERWGIATDHFDPHAGRRRAARKSTTPLDQVLVENSTYPRSKLKQRVLRASVKQACCEMCGQGPTWLGRPMALVLDHINGTADDNRLENLRIVCPNCAATLETHCGRNLPHRRECPSCRKPFAPRNIHHRYCSVGCWGAVAAKLYKGVPHPDRRKVPRPSYEQLMADLRSMSYCAAGRKYGVSDTAIRKWVRWYEQAREADREREDHGQDFSAAA